MASAWIRGLGVVHYEAAPRKKRGNVAGRLEEVRATRRAIASAVQAKAEERRKQIAVTTCGRDLQQAREGAAAVARAEIQRARAGRRARVAEARETCRAARKETQTALDRALTQIAETARAESGIARREYGRPRTEPSPTRSRGARKAAATRAERIELEARNVDPELEPLFLRMAPMFMARARKLNRDRPSGAETHAYELFHEWAAENPAIVDAERERQAELAVRRALQQEADEEIPF